MSRRNKSGDDPQQLPIDWPTTAAKPTAAVAPIPAPAALKSPPAGPAKNPAPMVQRLPWDFHTSFPGPTEEAIEAGVVAEEDANPENVKSMHQAVAQEMLTVLRNLDAAFDARRRGVDPNTGKPPTTFAGRERLRRVKDEPARLQQWLRILLETYEEAFGSEAALAFDKAIRAWHAGIKVVADGSRPPTTVTTRQGADATKSRSVRTIKQPAPRKTSRIIAHLPVPRPLPAAVEAGLFGHDENGRPIAPDAREVREITQQHAEKLIDLLDSIHSAETSCIPTEVNRLQGLFDTGIAKYRDDFGDRAAQQLEAFARRQAKLRAQPFSPPTHYR